MAALLAVPVFGAAPQTPAPTLPRGPLPPAQRFVQNGVQHEPGKVLTGAAAQMPTPNITIGQGGQVTRSAPRTKPASQSAAPGAKPAGPNAAAASAGPPPDPICPECPIDGSYGIGYTLDLNCEIGRGLSGAFDPIIPGDVQARAGGPEGSRRQPMGTGPWTPEEDFMRDLSSSTHLLARRVGGEAARLGIPLSSCIPAPRSTP